MTTAKTEAKEARHMASVAYAQLQVGQVQTQSVMCMLSSCLCEAADSTQAPPSPAGTAPALPGSKPAAAGVSGASQVQPPPATPGRCVLAEKEAGSQGVPHCVSEPCFTMTCYRSRAPWLSTTDSACKPCPLSRVVQSLK